MRRSVGNALVAAVVLGAAASMAMAGGIDLNVAIRGEIAPGVYGRIDLGGRPPPPLVYEQPVVIERAPTNVVVAPIYLHVPPEHAHNWRRYCGQYHACNRPVYFVRSAEYEPGYHRDDHHDRHDDQRRDHYDHRDDHSDHHDHRNDHRDHHDDHHDDHGHHDDHDHHDHDDR